MNDREETYWLKSTIIPGSGWVKVAKTDWIRAERNAGFRPKLSSDDPAYMTTCATGGFSDGSISGCTRRGDEKPTH